jgi:hypothetical protein
MLTEQLLPLVSDLFGGLELQFKPRVVLSLVLLFKFVMLEHCGSVVI